MLEYWYYDGKSSDQNSQSDDSSIDSSNEPASKSGESMWKLAIEGLKPFTADEWNAGQFLTRVMLTLRVIFSHHYSLRLHYISKYFFS